MPDFDSLEWSLGGSGIAKAASNDRFSIRLLT
jgi:hypothetical protein